MSHKKTTEQFIRESILVHGNTYDYSLTVYETALRHVKIICKKHGEFNKIAVNHIRGQGCPFCSKLNFGKNLSNKIIKEKFKGIIQPEEYKLIPLTKGKFAKVDNEDFEKLSKYNWAISEYYAYNSSIGMMHRYIMNTPEGMVTDHINGETLDNRKSNLRICTNQENVINQKPQKGRSSQYKGVSWHKSSNKWRAYLQFNNKQIHLGTFDCEISAAKEYDRKSKEIFGEFALTNF